MGNARASSPLKPPQVPRLAHRLGQSLTLSRSMSSRCEPRHGDGWVLYNIVLGRGCALSRRLRMPTFGPEEIMTGFRNSGPLCSTTHPPVDDGTAMPSSAAADDITRARTLIHEESHFVTAGGTDDVQSTFPGDPRKPGGRRCTATPRPLD